MSDFNILRNFDFQNATAHLWVFKESKSSVAYKACYVQTSDDLADSIKEFANDNVEKVTEVQAYTYLAENNECSCLSIDKVNTRFPLLEAVVDRVEDEHKIDDRRELKNSKGYVVKFDNNAGVRVYGVRRSTSSWKTAYNNKFINIIFQRGELSAIEDDTFSINKDFDFFVVNDSVFMLNKRGFETLLQHREAYAKAFDDLQQSQSFNSLFTTMEPIVNYVGSNSMHLRRMAVVENKAIYSQPGFLTKLREVSDAKGWGMNFDEAGQIIPCEDTAKLIVQVLLDHRLQSLLTNTTYDVPDAVAV